MQVSICVRIGLGPGERVAGDQILRGQVNTRLGEVTFDALTIASCESPDGKPAVTQLGGALSSSVAGLETSIGSHEAANLLDTGEVARLLYVGMPKCTVE